MTLPEAAESVISARAEHGVAADSPPSHSLGPLAVLARLAAERPTVRRPTTVNVSRRLWVGSITLILVGLAVIGALLIYYRPTVEYAYVDIIDMRETPAPGWSLALLGGSALLLVAGGLLWLRRKANR